MNAPRNWLLVLITCFWLWPGVVLAQLSRDDIATLRERGRAEGWTFTVGENQATRRPLHELCGAVEPPDWRAQAAFDNRPATRDLPASFDWRDSNGCTAIRSQGSCGSCWAFGAIGTVESMLQLNEGECVGGSTPGTWCRIDEDCPGGGACDLPDVDLSEQWLVSCTASGTCGGGWHTEAFEYLKLGGLTDPWGHSGAVLEVDFPYTAADDPCGGPYPHPHAIWSWAVVGPEDSEPTATQIKQAIMDHGPVAVGVYVSSAFGAYDGGVFNACEYGGINHIVDLVGWDDNQGSAGVWFLRNSWDTDWGEDENGVSWDENGDGIQDHEGGYMRIEYGCNRVGYATCYMNYSAQDCNGNTIADRCDVSCESAGGPCDVPGCGGSPDCNGNKIPDECDITAGISPDYNSNGIPDECEPDCNGNDVPDECDISCAGGCAGAPDCGSSTDCQPDGMPDECQITGVTVPAPAPPCSASATNGLPWCDDFESYGLGVISGNNWEGWYGDAAALGTITDEQNHTPGGSQSLKIVEHDTVHVFTGYNLAASAYWLLRAHVYVPSTMTGDAMFIVNPDYPAGTSWAVQLTMNAGLGTIDNHYGPETLPLVTDAWVEIRCEINLAADLITIYYDDQFLASYLWTIGGGSLSISALDLFSPDSSGFYYDDLSLYPAISRDCNGNDTPDDCDPDCNMNSVPDDCDLDCGVGECASHPFGCGGSADCNTSGVPDECELDTDGDGMINDCEDDDDNDGVLDGDDTDPLDPDVCADVDGDTCDDCAIGTDDFGPLPDNDPGNDGPDNDLDVPDGICDAGDNCDLPNPDQDDCQPNGIGDVCDLAYCVGEVWCDDCNGNEVPDDCDIAGGTSTDNNGNGRPDECIQNPVAPDAVPKNRYVSFDANNSEPVAFHLEMVASAYFPGSTGVLGWVGEPFEAPEDPGVWVARVVDTAFYSDSWPAVVYLGDCAIVPVASYALRATPDGVFLSDPLTIETTAQPVPKYWADCVGALEGGAWTGPNGVVNMDDVMAAVQKFTDDSNAPPLICVDLEPEVPNAVLNFTDIFWIVQGFKGEAYPFNDPLLCP